MATLKQCISRVSKAIDEQFEGDLDGAQKELQDLMNRVDKGLIADQELYDSLEELVATVNTMAKIKKRNTMLNQLARTRVYRYLEDNHLEAPARGIDALIVGIQSGKYGARDSLERRMDSVVRRYYEGFMKEIGEDKQVEALFMSDSPEKDLQITKAMWELGNTKPNMKQFDPAIAKLADIMVRYQEMARLEANEAGAWIGKLDNYMVSQQHDAMTILRGRRNKVAGMTEREDWIAYMKQALDHERTFGAADPDEFLNAAYNNIIDGSQKSAADGSLDRANIALTGSRNIGRSMSHERVLHFKRAEDWYDYNQQWGKKIVREAFMADITKRGNDIAMMQMLGPNPRANLMAITEMLAKKLHKDNPGHPDIQTLKNGWNDNGKFKRAFDIVDGTANGFEMTKQGATAAFVGGAYRGVVTMSTLGGMILSMITDPAIFAQSLKSNAGRGWFASLGNAVGSLVEAVGKTPEAKRDVARKLGVFQDAILQNVGARFGIDRDWTSGMQRSVNTFMKLNLAAWWTDNLKMSAAIMFASDVGDAISRGVKHGDLSDELSRSLGRSGIGAAEWRVISKTKTLDYNGNPLAEPEAIRNLDDSVFEQYLKSQNRRVTKRAVNDARTRIEEQLRAYYIDMSEYSVLTPDAKTNRLMQKHHQRGSFQGEFWRMVMMLKSFGIGFIQKSLGQEVFGRGYQYNPSIGVTRNALRALKENRNGEFANVLSLMSGMTALGYGAMYAKDLAKGKEPASLEDPRTYARAILQGGGLGILGDFLVGEALNNRYGHSPLATLAGPAGGTIEDVVALYGGAVDLATTGETDKIAKESWDLILGHTPYQNHFLFRPIADYSILYSIQEAMNPGYLRRMEGYVKKQTGQEYFAPPSEGGIIGAIIR